MGKQALSDLMLFDAIIGNVDRHLGNLGMLIDNDTNELIKPAPIFDNGRAFINFIKGGKSDQVVNHFKLGRKYPFFKSYFNHRFDKLVKMHATPRHLELLDKIEGFAFTPHPKYTPSVSFLATLS
ncbi:hypothetical protein NHP190012_10060 [Helicobacter sp. NHP19-012]|uniref:HipA-like C-terminal domain-containing protein n=1 Tax=Helicobacter gastrofelis TaxID=2849642 RepID=A0ABN6I9M8_9HELI|nr:hypothetical protein [Helicobacter sp. NHP19-012]BCZ19364.1 hypothetical protein NHP190012_10060 [Helicobacter sp. NHP19-012]